MTSYPKVLEPCVQVKMFGGFVRWQADLPPPDDAMPARMALTTIGTALRYTGGPNAGPVHLNCQLREPLGPSPATWDPAALQVRAAVAIGYRVLSYVAPLIRPTHDNMCHI